MSTVAPSHGSQSAPAWDLVPDAGRDVGVRLPECAGAVQTTRLLTLQAGSVGDACPLLLPPFRASRHRSLAIMLRGSGPSCTPTSSNVLSPTPCQLPNLIPQALLRASGGALTDLFGGAIPHTPTARTGNILGVLASAGGRSAPTPAHAALCARLRLSGRMDPVLSPLGLRPRCVPGGARAGRPWA